MHVWNVLEENVKEGEQKWKTKQNKPKGKELKEKHTPGTGTGTQIWFELNMWMRM